MIIEVFIPSTKVIPNAARLLGIPQEEIVAFYREAELNGRLCIFQARTTPTQWEIIKQLPGCITSEPVA